MVDGNVTSSVSGLLLEFRLLLPTSITTLIIRHHSLLGKCLIMRETASRYIHFMLRKKTVCVGKLPDTIYNRGRSQNVPHVDVG